MCLLAVVCACLIATAYLWYISNFTLTVTQYEIETEKTDTAIRVAQLSDLHGYEFGKDNARLVSLIEESEPDIIVMTGDMLNYDESMDSLVELVGECVKTAPVYFSLGNHETDYEYDGMSVSDVIDAVSAAGAIVLEQEYVDTQINGTPVRIGGLFGYVLSEPEAWMDGSEQEFMRDFEDTDDLKILLSHMSEGLYLWRSMETFDVDLIFSGHRHGGEVILPFVGPLYASEEGWFPSYAYGVFELGDSVLVLSRGLGTSGIPGHGGKTRWNNVPELVIADIVPAGD